MIKVPLLAALVLLAGTLPAPAYVDGGGWQVTLPELVSEFRTITLVEVEKVNLARGGFRYRMGQPLKGKPEGRDLKLQIAWGESGAPFKEAKAGRVAVHFTQSCDRKPAPPTSSAAFENLIAQRGCLTFMDGTWFYTTPDSDGWQSGTVRRDFELVFVGSSAELAQAVSNLLRGHEVMARCRRLRNTAETHWIRYTLDDPNNKALAREPAGPAAQSRPPSAWVADLRDPSALVRTEAALALAELGTSTRESGAALVQALRDPDPDVRCAAVVALGATTPEGKAVIDGLARALSDEDWFVRLSAAPALGNFGPRAAPAVPALVRALSPGESVKDFRPVRCAAAMVALSRIDPRAKELEEAFRIVVGKLLEDERHGSFGGRARGARLLGECGASALPVVPRLSRLLRDPDGDVRVAAAEALLKIAPGEQRESALGVLAAALLHPELLVRRRAAEALGRGGPLSQEALPALRALAQDPEPEVRQAADAAMKRIGAKDRE